MVASSEEYSAAATQRVDVFDSEQWGRGGRPSDGVARDRGVGLGGRERVEGGGKAGWERAWASRTRGSQRREGKLTQCDDVGCGSGTATEEKANGLRKLSGARGAAGEARRRAGFNRARVPGGRGGTTASRLRKRTGGHHVHVTAT